MSLPGWSAGLAQTPFVELRAGGFFVTYPWIQFIQALVNWLASIEDGTNGDFFASLAFQVSYIISQQPTGQPGPIGGDILSITDYEPNARLGDLEARLNQLEMLVATGAP